MASKVKKIVESQEIQEVDGTLLTQTIVVTTYCREGSDTPSRTEIVDTRQIGERVYTHVVVEDSFDLVLQDAKTSMTDEEVAAFMEEWDAKWKPSVDESEVAKAQEVQQPIQSVEDEGAGTHDNEDGRPEDQKAEETNNGAEDTIQEDNTVECHELGQKIRILGQGQE